MDPSTVLTALAELTPDGRPSAQQLDVAGNRALLWLADPHWSRATSSADRLAVLDVLHRDERPLRRGWAFLLGRAEADGATRRVCLPLLSEPVRMRRAGRGYRITSAGDLELHPLVTDRELAARLEAAADVSGAGWLRDPATVGWVREAAAGAGLAADQVELLAHPDPADTSPPRRPVPPQEGILGVVGAALYVAREAVPGGVRDTLTGWARRDGLAQTALAAIYDSGGDGEPGGSEPGSDPADDQLCSPLPLNPAQAELVRRARRERIAAATGPPGSGKSHAVVAAALEVVDRGGSVLLVTQSSHAADVLGELLERYPGPTPVLFGDAEAREKIASELAAGSGRGYSESTLRADATAVATARRRVGQLSAAVDAALDLERLAADLPRWQPLLPALRIDVPRAFDTGTDLARAGVLAERVAEPATGWWQRLVGRRADRRLRRLLGASAGVPLERLRSAIDAGRVVQAAATVATTGGTDLGPAFAALHEAEEAMAAAAGTAMRHRAGSAARWSGEARASVAGLAGALRAGRNRRRQLLAGMDGAALVRALPLWVGTAADAEDLLPPVPGLFDLVILDEASHLDQLRAAPVLARGRRALVVGDPRQLRFVSFVADVDVATTLRRHGLDDRLDVRRMSAFDLAAAATPVTWLDQHYRSVPHLIGFSAERFYRGRLTVATRHPANESLDAIEVVTLSGAAVRDGVNEAEVTAAVEAVRERAAQGARGIAVVSPFRAQADALEAALVEAFSVAEMERYGLRVGTVHAFQGSEAPTVVASLGLVDADAPARVRFVSDPQLFNVLITRAREQMVVVTSLRGADGLIGEYLGFGAAGPLPPEDAGSAHAWTAALATELRRSGAAVRCGYPVGRWEVDLCLGQGEAAIGLVTRVHPDGPLAHRQRQRALAGAGWRLVDAFASRWSGDPAGAALELSIRALAPGATDRVGRV